MNNLFFLNYPYLFQNLVLIPKKPRHYHISNSLRCLNKKRIKTEKQLEMLQFLQEVPNELQAIGVDFTQPEAQNKEKQ